MDAADAGQRGWTDGGPRTWAVALAALGLLVFVPVALIVGSSGFTGLYGQDSFFYHAYATGPLRASLPTGIVQPPDFAFPPGFPLVTSGLSLVLGTDPFAGQVVALLAGAAAPVATALLARELAIQPSLRRDSLIVPLLAGLLVAVTPHLWQSSAVVMSDTSGLAMATFGAWAIARWPRTGSATWLICGAALLAFAIAIRWVYALPALVLAAAVVVDAVRARGRSDGRVRAWPMVVAGVVAVLVLAPMLVPMATAAANGGEIPFASSLRSHPWDPLNAFRSTFDGADGHVAFEQSMGVFYLLQPAQPYYLTIVFALAAVVGLVPVLRDPNTMGVAALVAWPLVVIGFLVGDMTQNTRFMLAALPPLAILAALGVGELAHRLGRMRAAGGRWAIVALALVVLVGVVATATGAARFTSDFVDRQLGERDAIRSLASRVPADARLIAFGATPQLRHDGRTDTLELYDQGPEALVAAVGDGRPTYLIVPWDGFLPQWQAAPPGHAFAALRDGPGLVEQGSAGSWRLFAVGSSPILPP